jgi:hypothetical protein
MLVGKASSMPLSRTHGRYFTRIGSSLTHKCLTTFKRFAGDKHSSLLYLFTSRKEKKCWEYGLSLVTKFQITENKYLIGCVRNQIRKQGRRNPGACPIKLSYLVKFCLRVPKHITHKYRARVKVPESDASLTLKY